MKRQKDLYELIRSLNKSEKRYFKLYSNKYGNGKSNNYIQIFDFINKKNINSDHRLLLLFDSKLSTNQLAVTKSYLYDMLIASMGDYHKTQKDTPADTLIQIDFLIHKGLIDQAKNLVKIAQKRIRAQGLMYKEQELIELELKISNYTPDNYGTSELDEFYTKQKKLLAQHELVIFYKYLFYKKNILEQKSDDNGMIHYHDGFENIYKESLAKSESEHHTFFSKYYLHLINKHCTVHLGKLDLFFFHGKLLIAHLKNHPVESKQDPEKIVWAYYSYIYSSLLLKKETSEVNKAFKEFEDYIENDLSKNLSAYYLGKMVYHYFYLRRNVMLRDIRFDESIILDINDFVTKSEPLIPLRYKMLFQYYFAYHYFNEANYNKCLHYLQEAIRLYNQKTGTGKDVFIMSKLLRALTYKELNEDEYLQYSLQSVYRYLHQDGAPKIFEKKLLILIKTMLKTKLDYNQLSNHISTLNSDQSLNGMIELFDIHAFIYRRKTT